MKIFIFKLLCILIFKNAINKIKAGKRKHQISFDEIFGQFGQSVQQFDQIVDELLEVKEEESEEMSTNCDELGGQLPMLTNNEQIYDDFSNENNKKKREIVKKFHKIKEKIMKMRKNYSVKELNKIERKIAKKLGTNQRKIYEWKREFELIKKFYSDDEKRKILKRFDQIYDKLKMKLNEKLEGKKTKCQKILAKHLGTNIRSIYKWKKQFKNGKLMKNQKNDEKQKEIVEKYFKIKNEFMKNGKHSEKEWKEFRAKIKQIFAVNYVTIERWANKLSIKQKNLKGRKFYTIAEKLEKIKQYYQFKTQNPMLTDRKIAEILNIPKRSLENYKSQFKRKVKTKNIISTIQNSI